MSFGQGGPQQPWDPWRPHSEQTGNGGAGTPDWAALAERSAARGRRRRLFLVGGGALAAVAAAVAVAMAVVSSGGPGGAAASPAPGTASAAGPSGATASAPSFAPTSAPPPLDPKDFVSSAAKDRAPLDPGALFPGTRMTMGDAVYGKGPVADTRSCATAARGTLPQALDAHDCTRLIRVTYRRDGVAVTVGVAVFDTAAKASAARAGTDRRSTVRSLSGEGVPAFCAGAVCRSTTNSYGRYAYFTLAGRVDGKDVTQGDAAVFRAGDDLAEFTFRQIHRRGRAQASAAAAAD
ncbi:MULTISPECIES: hypothetical protein [unclassified Streptomyces]|uniref:hypothetical protein n=1 Tax=unclassified Streptomyces TaxID=2593676 RepID=UPI0022376CED|nr:hypothetical protein [Streptomyces sp. SHP 1-2]MCW5251516.1 hypothetical protein [Streptomyces sp. SHP 1-2]